MQNYRQVSIREPLRISLRLKLESKSEGIRQEGLMTTHHPFRLQYSLRVVRSMALLIVLASSYSALAQELSRATISPEDTSAQALPDAPSQSAQAGSKSFWNELGQGVLIIGKDELTFIKAPFRKQNIKWDILAAAALTPLFYTDEQVANQVNPAWHDTGIAVSNGIVGAEILTAGGIFVTGLATDNAHAKDTGVAAARGVADAVVLYGVMKPIFARQRPGTNNNEGNFFSGNWQSGSFPSGHSMFNWTLASVIAHEYPKWPVELAVYGLAATSSTMRVTAGMHFPSDVVAGSLMGFLIGRYVARQNNHLPGESSYHSRDNRVTRVEDAILSHVTFGVQ